MLKRVGKSEVQEKKKNWKNTCSFWSNFLSCSPEGTRWRWQVICSVYTSQCVRHWQSFLQQWNKFIIFFFGRSYWRCHSVFVCVCASVVTDVHPVAAGTVLHILHVLSDSDGQQVVLFNNSKHFNPLSLYLSLFQKPNTVDEIWLHKLS